MISPNQISALQKPTTHLKLSMNIDPDQFKIQNVQNEPNRHICFIKTKIIKDGNLKCPLAHKKGSGVMISHKHILTAFHNVSDYTLQISKLINQKAKFEDLSYVKLALHHGTDKGRYKIKQIYQTPTPKKCDFAILQIQQYNPENHEKQVSYIEKYPIPLSLSTETAKKIKMISVMGYPIEANKNSNNPNLSEEKHDKSSFYINDQYGASGAPKQFEEHKITYTLPTEIGISGGPIFYKYKQDFVLLGIHKGTSYKSQNNEKAIDQNQNCENIGVSCGQMLRQINELGYKLQKRPFIMTEKTWKYRNLHEIKQLDVLFLFDKKLGPKDILVLSAFDLNNIRGIVLSGNEIGNEGVQFLLRRNNFRNLKSLYLTQNRINSLDHLSKEHWLNISSISTLSLSVNKLRSLPQHLLLLDNLKKLYLNYCYFENIPDILVDYCLRYPKAERFINIYKNANKIKTPETQRQIEIQKKKRIIEQNSNTKIIVDHQVQNNNKGSQKWSQTTNSKNLSETSHHS